MLIPLTEWDKRHYLKRHSPNTLRKWAANGYTEPAAVKHGNQWLIDEEAVYVGPPKARYEGVSQRALEILNNVT